MEKSRSLESSAELSFETFGKDKKRSKTPAPLVEQMALCLQQSLTKTLDLQPKTLCRSEDNDLPKLPPRSNDNNICLQPKCTDVDNNFTMSLPANYHKQNKSNSNNFGFEITDSFHAKNSTSPQNQLPDPQAFFDEIKSTNYPENPVSSHYYPGQIQRYPLQQHNFPNDYNSQNQNSKFFRQNIAFIPQQRTNVHNTIKYQQQQQQQQQMYFQQPTALESPSRPPSRPINPGKYPTNYEKQQQQQQHTITNFPTSHWV